MDAFLQDLKQAFRGITRSPGVAAAAIACFALGIGANVVMFGIVDALFLRAPAHVRAPEQVVRVYMQGSYPGEGTWVAAARSYPEYLSVAKQVPAFTATAAYWPTPVSIGVGAGADWAQAELVSQSYFSLLGAVPERGRFLEKADDQAGAPPVVVLSDAFWARHFGRDTAALGRTLDIGGMPCVIVGMAPRGFTGIDLSGPDLWLPIAATGPAVFAPDVLTSVGDWWLGIIGRMRPGVAEPAAIAQVTTAFASAGRPVSKGEPPTHVLLGPIQEARGPDRSREASIALWVGAMAVIVLLIACANVTNLLLARGVSRRRDIGIRLAVGARPYRIARMLVLEAVVLAGLGAIAAMLLALWGAPVVQAYFLPNATGHSVLDVREILIMSGVALSAALVSVSVPAWRATRPSLAMSLTSGPRETGGQRWRGVRALLAVQTALALVLLVGAGLFVQSVRHLEDLDLGLQPDRVLRVTLDARGARIPQDQIPALYARLADVTRGLGGVQSVSLSMGSPFYFSFGGSLTLQDRPTPRNFPGGGPYQYAVTPDYFSTMGMRIVQGRGFTPEDRAGSAKVIVLNQTLASAFWPNQDPLGRCVVIGDDRACATVVGVVKDTPRWTVLELHGALYYVPFSQLNDASPTALYVRTLGQPDAMIAAVRRAVVGAAPNLPYIDIEPLESSVAPQLKPWRLGKTMFTMYGALALLLTALGLYGVLAYMVGRRTQEIGVRMALGAEAGRVRRMVLRDGMIVVGLGALAGAAVAIIGGRFIAAQLFQESPRDPAVLGAAGAALLLAAIAACWVPARRATRVNPVDALRAE